MKHEIALAGVDYVTLTHPTPDAFQTETRQHICDNIRRLGFGGQAGIDLDKWAWQGYTGFQFGSFRWGARRDGAIVTASGEDAGIVLESYHWAGWTATRIDVQATVRSDVRPDTVIDLARSEALIRRSSGANGRPWQLHYIAGYGDGDTLNIGSRRAQVYVRVYNKEAESPDDRLYKGCVRYEVEFKGRAAATVMGMLVDARDIPRESLLLVATKMRHYGITALDGLPVNDAYNVRAGDRVTDLDTQLLWLERSVRPLLKRLLTRGYRDDIMAILGLNLTEDDGASGSTVGPSDMVQGGLL